MLNENYIHCSNRKVSSFHYCKNVGKEENGNLFNWETSEYQLFGYITEEMDKAEVCQTNEDGFEVIGSTRVTKNFHDGASFCDKIYSGYISVAEDNFVVQKMEEEAKNLGIKSYYNGFVRNITSKKFVHYYSKKHMPTYLWMNGQPNNYGNQQNCVTKIVNDHLNDLECTTVLNPLCQVKINTAFQLTGICRNVSLDFDYTLKEVKGLNSK